MKIYNINKIFSVLVIAMLSLVLIFTATNAKASSNLDFSLECGSVDNNRLFNVDLVVDGNTNLSASDISITYNTKFVEFREVSSPDKAFEIKKKVSNGKVTAIILCSYGYNISGKSKILSFKFKSINNGASTFGLSISDPVDNNAHKLSIGSVYGAKVTINGKKITSKSIKTTSNKTTKPSKVKSSDKSSSSKDSKSANSTKVPKVNYADDSNNEEVTTTSAMDNIVIDDTQEPSLFVMGILVTLILVGIICIAYRIGKNSNIDENNKDDK